MWTGCLVLLMASAAAAAVNDTEAGNNKTGRSGRWYKDHHPEYSVQLGYYASPDSPVYNLDDDDSSSSSRKDKDRVPTSFADFVPDPKADKKYQYSYPKGGAPSWKGYPDEDDFHPAAPWMFPADMASLLAAQDDKPIGLLAKLKAEPLALFIATVLPLSVLLAAVLPSLINLLMNGNMMAPPPVTTTATGETRERAHRSWDSPSLVASVLEAVDSFGARYGSGDKATCLQRTLCHFARGVERTELRSVQQGVFDVVPFLPEAWTRKFGLKDLKEALRSGDCSKVSCGPGEGKNKATSSEKKHLAKKGDKGQE